MLDINKILSEYKSNEEFINATKRRYTEFINISDLPPAYRDHNIDTTKISNRWQTLNDNFFEIVNNRYSYVFNVENYKDTGYVSSLLLDTYFSSCLKTDNTLDTILYVDTNLILEDFKKMMDMPTSDYRISLAHNIDTLTKYIETAPYVIWDKFSIINSNYDKQKLYNLLLIRARNGFGNMFFIKNAPYVLGKVLDEEICNVMNFGTSIVDLSRQQIIYKDAKDKGGTKW